ncbi:MAG: AsmA family protein, partial [Alphaproteobacteria bacterium]|nr:AsmA family protein [Alphaproteobacteria bacterium]
MRHVLIGVLVLLVLAVGTLAAAPHFIDPDHFRTVIAGGLRRVTGREVAITGPISLSLLPIPKLSAGDVRVANPAGAVEPDLLRVATVDLRLGITPLLTGRLVLRSVILTDPVLDLERLADGRMNWRAVPRAGAGASESADGNDASTGAGGEPSVSVAALRVTNGAVIYHAADGTKQLDHLDLTADTDEITGRLRAAGRFRTYRKVVTFDLASDRPAPRTSFRLTIGLPESAASAELSGELATPPGGAPSVTGSVRASGDNLAALAASFGQNLPPTLARKF